MACAVQVPLYGYASTTAWDTSYTLVDEPLSGDFYFTFTGAQGSLGAVVGVTPVDAEAFASYLDIQYGIHFRQNQIIVVENGAPRGAWIDNDLKWEYTISRLNETVYYTRRDTLVTAEVTYDDRAPGIPIIGELLYVSEVPSYGAVLMDSSFYAVGDSACFLAWGSDAFVDPEFAPLVEPGNSVLQDGRFPLAGRAGGSATADPAISAMLTGSMGLDGSASGRALQGVYGTGTGDGSGHLYLDGWGSDTEYTTYAYGYLAFAGGMDGGRTGIGSISVEQSNEARVTGYLGLTGSGYADELASAGVYAGQLPLEGAAAGSATADPAIQAVASWELPLDIYASGSAQYANYFQIVLPELIGLDSTAVEITEEIRASMAMDAQYAIMVRDFITVVGTPSTFSTITAELLETVQIVTTTMPTFALWVQETLGITDAVTIVQAIEMAETLRASGMVQTQYQGVVAVLSAVLISDGGAGAEPVGSGAILDATGTLGDPAEIALYGWFPTGSVIGISYTADAGGPGSVSYTLTQHQTGEQVAQRLVALLDAEPYLSSTYAGSGVIQILPDNGATVVNI